MNRKTKTRRFLRRLTRRVLLAPVFVALIPVLISGVCIAQTDLQLELSDGTTINGRVDTFSPEGAISGEGIPDGLTLDRLVRIATGKNVDRRSAGPVAVKLNGGGTIFTESIQLNSEQLRMTTGCGLELIRLENLKGIVWVDSDFVARKFATPPDQSDLIVVQGRDGPGSVEGLLESIEDGKVAVNYRGKSQTISIEKVHALLVADLGLQPAEGLMAVATMVDGSTIQGALGAGESGLAIRLPGGNAIDLNMNFVSSIEIQSDNIVYLSSLDPVRVEQRATFTNDRIWQRNLSIEGNPMRLAGDDGKPVEYSNGIGTCSWSRIVFSNQGGYDRFQSVVGIDMETEGRGDCLVRVLGDGIELWSGRVTAGPAVAVDVEIRGLDEIELIVEPGAGFDLADHLDWANARMLRN